MRSKSLFIYRRTTSQLHSHLFWMSHRGSALVPIGIMPFFIHLKILPYFFQPVRLCFFLVSHFHECIQIKLCGMSAVLSAGGRKVFVKILHRVIVPSHTDSSFLFAVQRRTWSVQRVHVLQLCSSVLLGKVNPQEHTRYLLFTSFKKVINSWVFGFFFLVNLELFCELQKNIGVISIFTFD